jgi:sugar lactone lactonase YvrE
MSVPAFSADTLAPRSRRPEGLLVAGLGFAEGLRWRHGELYLSDIASGRVVAVSEGGVARDVVDVPGRPSGLGFLPDGRLLVVSMVEKVLFAWDGTELTRYADLSGLVHARLNDMVVAPTGHAYVTNFGYEERPRRATSVVHVRPDGSAQLAEGELWRPNGCAVTADGGSLIVAETRINRLSEFELDAEGRPSRQRTFAELPAGGWADGICLDVDGGVWVADPVGHQCVRVERGGRVTDVVDTAPLGSITCSLGGADGRRLFISVSELGDPTALLPRRQCTVQYLDVERAAVGSP